MLKQIDQEELIPTLLKAGICAKEYANPKTVGTPIEFFLTTIPGGKGILIKKGEKIGLKIAVDAEHRQAVLSVHEGKRKITKQVKFFSDDVTGREPNATWKRDMALRKFNMEIPGAMFAVSKLKEVSRKATMKPLSGSLRGPGRTRIDYTATVTATVDKESTNHFLMGMDETSHFIAILPEAVGSVKQAHRFLKPKGVGKNFKRQGEFFLVPTKKAFKQEEVRNSVRLEEASAHRAQYAIGYKYQGRYTSAHSPTHVRGLIFDTRGYRHAPVDLGTVWHKVIRNKEVNTTLSPSRRTRRFD